MFQLATSNTIIADPAVGHSSRLGIDSSSGWVINEIYSGLTKIDDDFDSPVRLDLAESFDVADFGRVYTFTLKPGLKFSDGSPVSASDFKWSWERALDPATGSERAPSILGWIEGASEIISGYEKELKGVEVIDERVLRITLTAPRSDFPALLADQVAVVLKRENVENWGITGLKQLEVHCLLDLIQRILCRLEPVHSGWYRLIRT